MTRSRHSVRAIAMRHGISSGGIRNRAEHYAKLIEQVHTQELLLWQAARPSTTHDQGTTPLVRLHLQTSLPPSPPITPASPPISSSSYRYSWSRHVYSWSRHVERALWALRSPRSTSTSVPMLDLQASACTAAPSSSSLDLPSAKPQRWRWAKAAVKAAVVGCAALLILRIVTSIAAKPAITEVSLHGNLSQGNPMGVLPSPRVAFDAPMHAEVTVPPLPHPCPVGWVAGHVTREDGAPRCFRATQHLATHDECAKALCPALGVAASNGGVLRNATLASIGSADENTHLTMSVLQGRDLWIGLYRTPGSGSGGVINWRWTSDEAMAGPPFTKWNLGRPDARFGREDCAYISGATGGWDDLGCELAELRCLCELDRATALDYHDAVTMRLDDLGRATKTQRMLATVVGGAILALPLTLPLEVDDSAKNSRVMKALFYIASICLVGGFTPFFAHMLGGWTTMQLGPFTNFLPLAPLGGLITVDALSWKSQRVCAIFISTVFFTIAGLSAFAAYALIELFFWGRCFYVGIALVKGTVHFTVAGCRLLLYHSPGRIPCAPYLQIDRKIRGSISHKIPVLLCTTERSFKP